MKIPNNLPWKLTKEYDVTHFSSGTSVFSCDRHYDTGINDVNSFEVLEPTEGISCEKEDWNYIIEACNTLPAAIKLLNEASCALFINGLVDDSKKIDDFLKQFDDE